jgi:hypothetical protein
MLAVVAGVGCARGGVEGPHADARVVGVGGSASGTAMVGRGDRTVGRPRSRKSMPRLMRKSWRDLHLLLDPVPPVAMVAALLDVYPAWGGGDFPIWSRDD